MGVHRSGSTADERIVGNAAIVRPVAPELALEQGECLDLERLAAQASKTRDERVRRRARAAAPPRERDVRMKGAALGGKADADAQPLDLGGQRSDRRARLDRGPQGSPTMMLEAPDP